MSNGQEAEETQESLIEELQNEYERIEVRLRELQQLLEHSQVEVNKLQQRNASIANRLTHIENNFETVPRSDIKNTYKAAMDARQRLITTRNQLEKLQSDKEMLEHFRDVLAKVLELLEGVSPAARLPGQVEQPGNGGLPAATIIRVVEAQEAERQRLARQMHDGPAQSLTNFILQAEICQRLFDRDPVRASEELNNLRAAANSTFQKVRSFIADLRPMMLDDLGLVPTVRRYIDTIKDKTNATIQLNITGAERRLEPHREVIMFRGIQELLTNARDHANASLIKVELHMDPDTITAVVEDNGRGFNVDEVLSENADRKALGLPTLKERIELIGGQIEIQSKEGEGTRVTISIPAGEPPF